LENQKSQKALKPNMLLTSHQVGELLQVDPSSIVKWVNDGILPAFRTPGGHRRIRSADLLTFLRGHGMYIPDALGGGSMRVLLVDDDRQLLTALQRGMKSHRDLIELSAVQSGIEALVKVGAEKPDALVIDVHMPEMDGLEVCARLRNNKDTQDMDVVMMTGKYTPELEQSCLKVGARALLPKPITASKLVEVLCGPVQSGAKQR
jgi:excisionase family DNA binding protein